MQSKLIALVFILLTSMVMGAKQTHIILTGGPALRQWEDLRVEKNRHDRWWANFIRASVLHIEAIKKAHGEDVKIVWAVHKKSYENRSTEDQKPLIDWIEKLAKKRNVKLVWFNKPKKVISTINRQPKQSIIGFDYFGHSNRYCFMFDYSSAVCGASNSWFHQDDIARLNRRSFHRKAICKSWGCYTGESMSKVWRRHLGIRLIGAHGKTDYSFVGQGHMPQINGHWVK